MRLSGPWKKPTLNDPLQPTGAVAKDPLGEYYPQAAAQAAERGVRRRRTQMTEEWRTRIASDVQRDGLGLELIDACITACWPRYSVENRRLT